jgi:hypothetical protein
LFAKPPVCRVLLAGGKQFIAITAATQLLTAGLQDQSMI